MTTNNTIIIGIIAIRVLHTYAGSMTCEKNLHGICTGRIENDGGEHGIRHRQSRTKAGPDYLPAWRRGSSDVVLPHEDTQSRPLQDDFAQDDRHRYGA